MLNAGTVVESLASAARAEGIPAGISEGCVTVPSIAHAFELVEFAKRDGWDIQDSALRCTYGDLDFTVPVIVSTRESCQACVGRAPGSTKAGLCRARRGFGGSFLAVTPESGLRHLPVEHASPARP